MGPEEKQMTEAEIAADEKQWAELEQENNAGSQEDTLLGNDAPEARNVADREQEPQPQPQQRQERREEPRGQEEEPQEQEQRQEQLTTPEQMRAHIDNLNKALQSERTAKRTAEQTLQGYNEVLGRLREGRQ